MQRDDSTLLDIARAARLIARFIKGSGRETFLDDELTQAAVLHEIVVIGEGVKRLSEQFRNAHPDIPWREIAGMRDRVIHQYDRVDLNLVWEAAERDIPQLLVSLEPLLPKEKE